MRVSCKYCKWVIFKIWQVLIEPLKHNWRKKKKSILFIKSVFKTIQTLRIKLYILFMEHSSVTAPFTGQASPSHPHSCWALSFLSPVFLIQLSQWHAHSSALSTSNRYLRTNILIQIIIINKNKGLPISPLLSCRLATIFQYRFLHKGHWFWKHLV